MIKPWLVDTSVKGLIDKELIAPVCTLGLGVLKGNEGVHTDAEIIGKTRGRTRKGEGGEEKPRGGVQSGCGGQAFPAGSACLLLVLVHGRRC